MALFLWTLVKLSLLGSAMAVVLSVLRPLLRRLVSRTAAYYLWLLVLLRLCVPLGIELPVSAAAVEPAPVQAAVQAVPDLPEALPGAGVEASKFIGASGPAPQPEASVPERETPAPARSTAQWWKSPYLWGALWWLGALASMGWFMLGYLRVSGQVRRSAGKAAPEAYVILAEMDPRGRVKLVESPAAGTPLLLGVARPVIVLPCGVTDKARLRDILAHELTHVRRHDLLFKWFAAAATSLHWFNPMMLLVRREIGRACELACDEAVMGKLDEAGRRHYGETLLALASHAPKGLGPLAVTLCEEKKQLKERLVYIVKYKKSGPLVLFLSLLLAAVVGACSLVTGVKPVEPDPPEEEQSSEEEQSLLKDVTLYELDGGLTLAIPNDMADQLQIFTNRENWQGTGEYVMSAYEKQSYEDAEAELGHEMGYLFGITRYTQEQYEQAGGRDGTGGTFFAADGDFYYMHTFATDFQFYRTGNNYTEEDLAVWEALEARVDSILADFMVRNDLEPHKTLGTAAGDLYRHITDPLEDRQYDFTAQVRHNNRTDEFHITPDNGYNVAFVGNYLFTYTWQEANAANWGGRDYWGTVLTLVSADGKSSIRCRSVDDVVELTQDGETWYAHVWDPETPEDLASNPNLRYSLFSFLMKIPEDAFSSSCWDGTADGSLSPAEAAEVLAESVAENYRNTPSWLDWKPLDIQFDNIMLVDAYYGEDDPRFCFWAQFLLRLDNTDDFYWQVDSERYYYLADPIVDGPFAGYYSWKREVLVEKNASGSWYINDYNTGGYSVDLLGWTDGGGTDCLLANAALEELVDMFFLTEGWTHDYFLPILISIRPMEEVEGLNDLLDRHTKPEAQELCRALAAYLNGYGDYFGDTLTSVEELNALLDPAYQVYTADVPPLG